MDEELIVKLIVQILLQRPAEWFTFNRMAGAVRIAGIDADVIGAIVDFRYDLFATSQDRRFKLQSAVVEQIALTDMKNWNVPKRPEKKLLPIFPEYIPPLDDPAAVHYCLSSDSVILKDLIDARIPEIALVTSCCWKRICQVRGRNLSLVPEDTWEEVCRFRGYLHARENPRGF